MGLTGRNNEEKIWNFLKSKGLSDYGVAGLMGNLRAESALNPCNLQQTYERKLGHTDASYTAAVDNGSYDNFVHDSAGYGLAQWTYWSRKAALLEFVKAAGTSIGDLETQLRFLYKELSEGYKNTVLAVLEAATDVRTASDVVLTKYERPANQGEAVKQKRASYGQTYYDKYAKAAASPEVPKGGNTTMKLIESILTKNPCYTCGRTITVKGLMLHSVGCPQPSAEVFVKNWNRADYDRACVHAFIDANTGAVYQTLPWNRRGWHAGAGANNTHIGVEMCEPSTIRYTGGSSWVETGDGSNTKACVLRTYQAAVELFAMLCKEYGLDPLADGVIISHKEGHARGVASNHGDPEHLWGKFGLTMNKFRTDVKAAMGTAAAPETPKEDKEDDKPAGSVLYYVQSGAYTVKANADAQAKKLKAKGFDVLVKKVGAYYKVQTGAYSKKANADAQLAKLKAAGFDAFVTTNGGTAAGAAADTFKVGDKVKCNDGVTKYSNGSKMASWVPGSVLYIRQIESGGKILLVSTEPVKKVYTGRVKASDVHKI